MSIDELYRTLLWLYDLDDAFDIEQFVRLTDAAGSDRVGNGTRRMEALLLRQTGEDLEIGLFLAPEVVVALECAEPLAQLDEFACAAEGVSHFVYVTDRAQRNMCVSKLELELQAEVDKFLLIHLIASAKRGNAGPELFERQFETFSFDPGLNDAERERYATASRYGAKRCFFLKERFFNPLRIVELASTSRDFFHRNLAGKLSLLTP